MASQQEIAREANARFWITTYYKPGLPLNPQDSADKLMAKRWLQLYRDLVKEAARGQLSLIHKHASFAARLNDAIRAYKIESTADVQSQRYAEARQAKAQALNEASMWLDMLSSPSREKIAGYGYAFDYAY